MKIEIAEPGRMSQTGSSLLKLIQNNNMPVLDLFVRESIQNSLDAKQKNAKYVTVEYITGKFSKFELNEELEKISEALNDRFRDTDYPFLAIKDSNTVGLTGELDYKKITSSAEYGNLLKLVYEICKPQDNVGAGGSWGIGKTVYFRIGIGLVIYYSRIKTENGYASRLAASLVEDETASNSMIPVYNSQTKRGIAWWGDSIGENITQPITDDNHIEDFLKIFSLKPYTGKETGTTVIIPYVNKEHLLSSNQIDYHEDPNESYSPPWCNSIEKYLEISAQRWYAPRLNNSCYRDGAFLQLKINGEILSLDKMKPVFRVIQSLYNRANYIQENELDFLTEINSEIKVEKIKVIKYLDTTTSGTVAFAKIPRQILGMEPPNNNPEPYVYLNCDVKLSSEINKPTVCFTRKPAMIVSYENVGAWTTGIPSTSKNEYIFAIFVLNSWNKMKNSPKEMFLEEYIRKCEMADHTSWTDWTDGTYNPRIVTKIQSGICKAINKNYTVIPDDKNAKIRSGFGKFFAGLLLPPEGFGNNPTPDEKRRETNVKGRASPSKGVVFAVQTDKIKYLPGKMVVPIILDTGPRKKINTAYFEIQIDTENNKMPLDEWEEKMSLPSPYKITGCKVDINMVDSQKIKESVILKEEDNEHLIHDILIKKTYTKSGTEKGLKLIFNNPLSITCSFSLILDIYRTDLKISFSFEKDF